MVGDVRGCQAAAHLGLSRTLFWHRLKRLPAIGGTGVPLSRHRLGTVRGDWSAACAVTVRMPPTNNPTQFPADGEEKVHPTLRLSAGASAGARSMCETIQGAPQPDTLAHHPPTNLPPPRLPSPPPRACPPFTTTMPTVYRVGGAAATRATTSAARMPRHASGPMVRSLCAPGQPENGSLRSEVSVVAVSDHISLARPFREL